MNMSNTNYKIVYSLRIHLALQKMGFKYETEMKNPQKPMFNCWVYLKTPELIQAFDKLIVEVENYDRR